MIVMFLKSLRKKQVTGLLRPSLVYSNIAFLSPINSNATQAASKCICTQVSQKHKSFSSALCGSFTALRICLRIYLKHMDDVVS